MENIAKQFQIVESKNDIPNEMEDISNQSQIVESKLIFQMTWKIFLTNPKL